MGTSSIALIWYLLCVGVFLFVAIVAGVLIVIGRRSEARARARLRARIEADPPKTDSSNPAVGAAPARPSNPNVGAAPARPSNPNVGAAPARPSNPELDPSEPPLDPRAPYR